VLSKLTQQQQQQQDVVAKVKVQKPIKKATSPGKPKGSPSPPKKQQNQQQQQRQQQQEAPVSAHKKKMTPSKKHLRKAAVPKRLDQSLCPASKQRRQQQRQQQHHLGIKQRQQQLERQQQMEEQQQKQKLEKSDVALPAGGKPQRADTAARRSRGEAGDGAGDCFTGFDIDEALDMPMELIELAQVGQQWALLLSLPTLHVHAMSTSVF
jgi:hypothetical protein